MSYYQKYLKYKNKYLLLQKNNQKGGMELDMAYPMLMTYITEITNNNENEPGFLHVDAELLNGFIAQRKREADDSPDEVAARNFIKDIIGNIRSDPSILNNSIRLKNMIASCFQQNSIRSDSGTGHSSRGSRRSAESNNAININLYGLCECRTILKHLNDSLRDKLTVMQIKAYTEEELKNLIVFLDPTRFKRSPY
jgi:hypothetical protein